MIIQNVTLVVNTTKPEALLLVREIEALLSTKNISSWCEEKVGKTFGLPWCPSEKLAQTDLCIVLGGDGTLIHAAYLLNGRQVPVLGINLGSLGFLTEIPKGDVFPILEQVLSGDYQTEPRMKLRVSLQRGSETLLNADVLNDAVINMGVLAHIADLEVSINKTIITAYKADGVIVATPTGSTGYSLSANGPILYPTLGAIIITPICPHTLTQRPIAVPDDMDIGLRLVSAKGETYLTLDGHTGSPLIPGDQVRIKKSPNQLLLIKNPKLDYFNILRAKLRWGER